MREASTIEIRQGPLHLVLHIGGDAPVRLLHLAARPFDPATVPADRDWAYRLVEVRAAGEDHDYIEAGRYAGSGLGGRLRYLSHSDEATSSGRRLVIVQRDEVTGLEVTSTLAIDDGVVESFTQLDNRGSASVTIEAVSSFFLVGATKEGRAPRGQRAAIHTPRNGWYAEFQWTRATASALGLNNRFAFGSRHETIASAGNWCSSNYLPMGYLENVELGGGLLWEILAGGSWSWQIGETAGELYLHLSGPSENESRWWKTLAPGDSFRSVAAVLAPSRTGFDEAIAAMVRHRRRTLIGSAAPRPVIFNDYMNCLMGDPTEAKVLPLIDGAVALGAEVYCMDAGWYIEPGARWSSTLGLWKVDRQRFPNGLRPVMDRIREHGMIPGLWFEIEAMTGTHPDFDDLPDDWFFTRHGRRVQSHRRFQLDFRNSAVRGFADQAIDMAVGELGCGFLKFDCNFDSGVGSEQGAESLGGALLDYQAAFLSWLDALRQRYPLLMIEHCASGGQRLGRPYLDRANVASSSDEGDPLQVARIAAAATTIILPEQNGTWALPEAGEDPEATAFAMLCAIPYRMNIAGGSLGLNEDQRALVTEAVEVHKSIRGDIASAVPSWPLGLPDYHDAWICAALATAEAVYVAVWRRKGGPARTTIKLPAGAAAGRVLYPTAFPTDWRSEEEGFSVSLEEHSGRLFRFPFPRTGPVRISGSDVWR
jgi:alpha-galactosidase